MKYLTVLLLFLSGCAHLEYVRKGTTPIPLHSSVFNGGKDHVQYHVNVETNAIPVELKPALQRKFVALAKEFGETDVNAVLKTDFYEYSYTIENAAGKKIWLAFSHWEVMNSPFSDAVGGFSVGIKGKSKKTFRFVSTGKPTEILTPMIVAQRFGLRRRWLTMGSSQASFYVPAGIGLSDKEFRIWKSALK